MFFKFGGVVIDVFFVFLRHHFREDSFSLPFLDAPSVFQLSRYLADDNPSLG